MVYVVIELFQGCLDQVLAFDDEDRAKEKARELIPAPVYDSERDAGTSLGLEKADVSVWKADDRGGDPHLGADGVRRWAI